MAFDADGLTKLVESATKVLEHLGPVASALGIGAAAILKLVKKIAESKPAETKAVEGSKEDPCGDLEKTVARLEHENERLSKQLEAANDRADKADARAATMQTFLDTRGGKIGP